MSVQTEIFSVHPFRRSARKQERRIQASLMHGDREGLPDWARGVRVEKAGPFSWAVVLTGHTGH